MATTDGCNSNVLCLVILACPESFSTIPDKQEGFPTSGNDEKRTFVIQVNKLKGGKI
jgi:hypothetical protein